MKKYLLFLCFLISINTYGRSNIVPSTDTISHWSIYNGAQLLQSFNAFSLDTRIILPKEKIGNIDFFQINYYDDTPCWECFSSLTIKTEDEKTIRSLTTESVDSTNERGGIPFKIKTVELQFLAFQHKSKLLKFYFKEHQTDIATLLFEVEIN